MLGKLKELFGHLAWADARAVEALQAAQSPPAKALEIMGHVLGTEEVWLSRLEQRKSDEPVWPVLSVDECVDLAARNRLRLERFLATRAEGDIERVVSYTNSVGQAFESKVCDILLHVAMHGSYHRG